MTEFNLKCGFRDIGFTIPERNIAGFLDSKENYGRGDSESIVECALQNPINSGGIEDIVESGDTIALVIDDHTRNIPYDEIIPPVLKRLHSKGVSKDDISFFIATGTHRASTAEEIDRMVGKDICTNYRFISHDCDSNDHVYLGKTSRGSKVELNSQYFNTDKKILLGDINLHYFAGYGGGRKSVVPGLSSRECIENNHKLMLDKYATSGKLAGNPLHEDLTEAVRMSGVDFILNVVKDRNGKLIEGFSGDLEDAFLKGTELVKSLYMINTGEEVDALFISAGGYPYDIDFHQSLKALENTIGCVKKNGTVYLSASCQDGVGYKNNKFQEFMNLYENKCQVEKAIKNRYVHGGHKAFYLYKALEKVNLKMISDMPFDELNKFKIHGAKRPTDVDLNAHSHLCSLYGNNYTSYVIPNANSITISR